VHFQERTFGPATPQSKYQSTDTSRSEGNNEANSTQHSFRYIGIEVEDNTPTQLVPRVVRESPTVLRIR
jgi:hypothetical protein